MLANELYLFPNSTRTQVTLSEWFKSPSMGSRNFPRGLQYQFGVPYGPSGTPETPIGNSSDHIKDPVTPIVDPETHYGLQ